MSKKVSHSQLTSQKGKILPVEDLKRPNLLPQQNLGGNSFEPHKKSVLETEPNTSGTFSA